MPVQIYLDNNNADKICAIKTTSCLFYKSLSVDDSVPKGSFHIGLKWLLSKNYFTALRTI